jgi:selenide,water dikinase
VLGALSVPASDRVLIDYRTSDDAGVYKLDDRRALVQTVDFFTPIVDDPFVYGQIAAANALSDVYAMGGRPITALAVAGFPKELDRSTIASIFSGGAEMLRGADVALLGGHTVQDQEIKFGYAVTGVIDPSRIWTNAGGREGDRLILTKALGTGIIATALKAGRAPQAVVDRAVSSMLTLNRAACEALLSLPDGAVHACTDITGRTPFHCSRASAISLPTTFRRADEPTPSISGRMSASVPLPISTWSSCSMIHRRQEGFSSPSIQPMSRAPSLR